MRRYYTLIALGSLLLGVLGSPIFGPQSARALITTAGKNMAVRQIVGDSGAAAGHNFCAVGTGTTAANAADTALQTEVGTRVQDTDADAGATGVAIVICSFAAGNGTGTLAEYGLLSASTAGTLLLRNVPGSTITKAAGDTLQITFTLTLS